MILLVAATEMELGSFAQRINMNNGSGIITVAYTGIGIAKTVYELTKRIIAEKPSCVLQVGIAGAFNRNLHIGEVVVVETEQWSNLGAEDGDEYLSVFDLNLVSANEKPYRDGVIQLKPHDMLNFRHLRKVSALTSDTAHGNNTSINMLQSRFNADIETMEGAAAAYVCSMENIPIIQIRAISNYVEKRDRERWNIPLALHNLHEELAIVLGEDNLLKLS